METRIDGRDGWIEVTRAGVTILTKGDDALRERLESAVGGAAADESLADVVTDELTTGGVRRTPDFAIVDAVARRVLVRGTARVRLTDDTGTTGEIVAPARGPWADEDLAEGALSVVLETGEPEPVAPGPQVDENGWAMPSVFGAGGAPAGAPAPEPAALDEPVPEPAPEGASGGDELPEYDVLFAGADQAHGAPGVLPEAASEAPVDSGPVAAAGGYQVPENPANATLAPPAEEEQQEPEVAPVFTGVTDNDPSSAPEEVGPSADVGAEAGPEVAGAAEDADPAAEPAPERAQFVDGHLVSSRIAAHDAGAAEQLEEEPRAADVPAADVGPASSTVPTSVDDTGELPAGPVVLAVRCTTGHYSAPHATRCRVCGQELPTQQPEPTMRPPLGLLRLSTGDVVTLDRGVLVGRAPRSPHEVDGADAPHLLRVASPDNEISRNHVEVVLDGWHVLVRDLGSTNGTTVTLPGASPVRVRPDDQQSIEPGTTITLADQVSMVFEVTG